MLLVVGLMLIGALLWIMRLYHLIDCLSESNRALRAGEDCWLDKRVQ